MTKALDIFTPGPPELVPETRLVYSKPHDCMGYIDRIRRSINGQRVTPTEIVILVEKGPADLEGFGSGKCFLRGRRAMHTSEIIFEVGLSVLARYEPVLPCSETPALVHMTVLGNTETRELSLKRRRLHNDPLIGNLVHMLTYSQDGITTTATLTEDHPNSYSGNHLWAEKKLTEEQRKDLKLEEKGIPKRVDWLRTFLMYTLRLRPDPDGNFSHDSKPLTAKDIFENPLIPVRS